MLRGPGIEHGISSGGTGTLTLTALSGKPTLASAFGSSGSRVVEYVVLDGNNMETGVGTVNLATLVLTRSRVQTTWDGSTWDSTDPSALNFTTSGTVICADTGWGSLGAGQGMNTSVGDNVGNIPLNCGVSTTLALTANRMYFSPALISHSGEWDMVTLRVTTGASSTNCKMGLYDVGSDGLPGNLLAYFGAVSSASATGVSLSAPTNFTSFFLPAGWYYMAIVSDGTPTLRSWPTHCSGPVGLNAGNHNAFVYHAHTYANAFPDPRSTGLTSGASLHAPFFSYRTRN